MSPADRGLVVRAVIAPRLARLADLPSIHRLNADAYAVYRARMDRPPAPVSHDYIPEVEAGQAWLIGGQVGSADPAGSAGLAGPPPLLGLIVLIPAADSLMIENVAVASAAQGRGLGRHLMEFAEQQAAVQDLTRLTLYTNEVMTENIAIYAKLGYRETSRRREHDYNRVFMEKRLQPQPSLPPAIQPPAIQLPAIQPPANQPPAIQPPSYPASE